MCAALRTKPGHAGGKACLQNLKTGQYSGKPVDLTLEDVDLKTISSRFAEISGIPFEVDPESLGEPMMSWTYKTKGVPWDQVLALVMPEFNLEAVQKGDHVYLRLKTGGREVIRITKSPAITNKLVEEAVIPVGSTPAEFSAYIKSEIARWGRVIKQAGIKIE